MVRSNERSHPALLPTLPPMSPEGINLVARSTRTRVSGLRIWLLGIAALLVLAAAVDLGWNWWRVGRFIESTDDAFTDSDAVAVAPQIAGNVISVSAVDNAFVRRGDALARIDDQDYRAVLAQGQAEIAEAHAGITATAAQIVQQQSQIVQGDADIQSDTADLRFAAQEQDRASSLSVTGAGTTQNVQRTSSQFQQKLAALRHAQAARDGDVAKIDGLRAGQDYARANLAKAQADVTRAELNLAHTVLVAPVDGIVADRSLRLGEYVRPGVNVLTIVPVGAALYVTANFKETQLHHMLPGQPVRMTADAFGDHEFKGVVRSVSPGTGAEFALLPPENATGNFTKVVQRVAVRIALDPADPLVARLRAGLSMDVDVDTRGDSLAARQ